MSLRRSRFPSLASAGRRPLAGLLLALALIFAQWVGLSHVLSHVGGNRAVAAVVSAPAADAPVGQGGGEVCERCLAFLALDNGEVAHAAPVPARPVALAPGSVPAVANTLARLRLTSSRDPPRTA